ncbi:carbohydrate sulfotransferase 3-like [Diadema antillarum]|uniref:carbohydrate sulfotransferase 3-like n=1 Tax=Diadema antillarum TaxID=105358 RepID=UPI003A84613C
MNKSSLRDFHVIGEKGRHKRPLWAGTSRHRWPVIVIMTQWRFGSTIVGEIFNQNLDLFYLYEPLWMVDDLRSTGRLPGGTFSTPAREESLKFLRGYARCRFSPRFVDSINGWGGRERNGAICRSSAEDCLMPSARWTRELCLKFRGRLVTKLLRVDLDLLKTLVVEDNIDLRIIHLVRDPRGSAASRIHYTIEYARKGDPDQVLNTASRLQALGLLNFTLKERDSIPGMCKWLRENVQHSYPLPDWLTGRYYLVRYDDFADDPVGVTKRLYKFTGLPLPSNVVDWVTRTTASNNSGSGIFETNKDSSATARKWMSDLNKLEIEQVEEECMDMMSILGYKRYDDIIKGDQD